MKTFKTTAVLLLAITALGLNSAFADQPRMRRALEHLRAAKAELEAAEHNKGGWRDRAIHNVNQAIADTERGMAFAR
jgi:hypothetical protein